MQALMLPTSEALAERCNADGEFRIAARHWTGGLSLSIGESVLALRLDDGHAAAIKSAELVGDVVTLSAPTEVWQPLLAAVPPRFCNDISLTATMGPASYGFSGADPARAVTYAQWYPAIARVVELLRPSDPESVETVIEPGALPRHDTPVGRYVHLELDGHDHRVYYEEAGPADGIPLLLQHTAGCHSVQWRHVFEAPAITEHFRVIAYDLPYHGKSLPPTGKAWWTEPYTLTASFVRQVPLALSAALGLDRPVFMGCSVGGVLALDLARWHPESFRAVISLEGVLKINTDLADLTQLTELWHPQVSNEFKARLMNSLMAPTSPTAYRKEISQVYAGGWPPVFLGDLNYYIGEFDLTEEAKQIDTSSIGVHILSGQYDASGTIELGRIAHESIPGSTFTEMQGVGHFPMAENPQRFIDYLLPVLDQILHAGGDGV